MARDISREWLTRGPLPETGGKRKLLWRTSRNSQKRNYISPLDFARYYAALPDRDRAFGFLEKAYREHAPGLIALEVAYEWDTLRTDARFQSLERRVGF
jgi:hypothetical protein